MVTMSNKLNLLLAFYADDFTGATDALEGLARNGIEAVLFLDTPTTADLDRFDSVDAIGIASTARSMSPEQMAENLPSQFRRLKSLGAPITHYKVCSTFDSAPGIGSIGYAIDLAQEVFESSYVPLVQPTTAPSNRYVAFGNLFADVSGTVYRLDRHPTMSEHPSTPMDESDIRRHLSYQTNESIGLVPLPALESVTSLRKAFADVRESHDIVVFDGITSTHLKKIGQVIWEDAISEPESQFVVGSSGIEHDALPAHWLESGLIKDSSSLLELQPSTDAVVVTSGSLSAETAAQIEYAIDAGFEGIRLDSPRLVNPKAAMDARKEILNRAREALGQNKSVLTYTAIGPEDPMIDKTLAAHKATESNRSIAEQLGHQQGLILRELVEETHVRRFCVAGGDTSSHVLSVLDIDALKPKGPISPGSPLCEAISTNSDFDGIEFVLKGGKSSQKDYFETVRRGGTCQY